MTKEEGDRVWENWENSSSLLMGEDFQEEYIFDRVSIRIIFIVMYSIVFIFCFFGNLIVLLVVTLHWRMRHITKFCLANLALADFMVGIFCVYQNLATYLINSWVLGEFMCKMYQFTNALSHTASVFTLVVVCIERYLAILHPLKCKRILTKKRLMGIVAAVWILSCLYCSPRLYYMNLLEIERMDETGTEIICTARRSLFNSRAFDMANSLFLFIFPLLLFSVLYFRVSVVLWGKRDNLLRRKFSYRKPTTGPRTSPPPKSTAASRPYRAEVDDYRLKVSNTEETVKEENEKISEALRLNWEGEGQKCKLESCLAPGGASPSSPCKNQPIIPDHRTLACYGSYYPRRKKKPTRLKHWRRKYLRRELKAPLEQGEGRQVEEGYLRYKERKEKRKEELTTRRSVVKMLIAIVICFALCNLPFHLRKFAVYWWPHFMYSGNSFNFWSTFTLPLSYLCMYGNSAINPIIYALMSSSLRASVQDLAYCRWKKSFGNANFSNLAAATAMGTTITKSKSHGRHNNYV